MSIALTNENYYSMQANKDYMSVSQFKDFAGTLAHPNCEDVALKKAFGYISTPKTKPLLVGSYIDSYFEGTLDEFKTENPEIFKKTGDKGLLADYKDAESIIRKWTDQQVRTLEDVSRLDEVFASKQASGNSAPSPLTPREPKGTFHTYNTRNWDFDSIERHAQNQLYTQERP